MQSSEWKEKRKAKLEACKSKCECESGCVREATQVHHLHYDTLGNESMVDLQALFSKCHMSKSSQVRNFLWQSCSELLPSHIHFHVDVVYLKWYTLRKNESLYEI